VLRIEQEALQRYLGALLGQRIENKLVFDDGPDQHPAMKRVRRMIFQFASDFNTRGALFSDLATAEMSRIAIMKFLMYTRHNYTHPGHFARDFRLAFGELPSDRLRRYSRRLIS
jgi:hypothetical protein